MSSAPSAHNDWARLAPPDLGQWVPTTTVGVIVVGDDPAAVARTTAALHQQQYPSDLLYLGSCGTDGAFPNEVGAAKGEIVVRIPAGAVPASDFVTALARWPHTSPEAVSLAVPMIFPDADPGGIGPDPDVISTHVGAGTLDQLFPGCTAGAELARRLAATHQLRTADHLAFLAVAGTAFAFRRDRYQAGADGCQGADVEVGYRLAQAGALFVPEPAARVWIPPVAAGASTAGGSPAGLADLMAYPREHRRRPGRTWHVPLVTAVVPADQPYEVVRSCVDRLLAGDERDLHVVLVADWHDDAAHRDGGGADLRLLAAEYRFEPRVTMRATAPTSAYPAPYLLRVPARLGVDASTVGALVAAMEKWRCGLLRVLPAGAGSATHAVELWSTAARARALHAGTSEGALVEAVAASHGQRWETGSEYGVVDLLADTVTGPATAGTAARQRPAQTVAVGGARSLGRATVFVARQYARGVRRRLVAR
ncbi:hypothetical protein ACN27F_21265 [Solwaraspora sp. WMMB335]|uniref:hypothetical protein n=1 Tax=Solwaraspora sp. WMMB335 TaxID=3404118 RepID=UPI003B95296D